MKSAAFNVLLLTAFLDVFGMGMIIPILPKIMRDFAASPALAVSDPVGASVIGFFERFAADPASVANGVAFSLFSVGMLIGGMAFGSLSDRIGRKRTLLFTSAVGVVWYALFGLSESLSLFLLGRLLSGLSGGGFPVTQAYVGDLFEPKERAAKMGMIGATFGLGFSLGPVIGGMLSSLGLQAVGLFSAAALLVDFVLIALVLPETKRHGHGEGESRPFELPDFPWKELFPVYLVAFVAAFGFSGMQSTFGLIVPDRFGVDQKVVGYFLGCVGLASIVFQGFLIGPLRKVLLEKGMMLFGLAVMTFAFAAFAINPIFAAVPFYVMLFPVGFGSLNVASSALVSRMAPKHSGKALGLNGSAMSLASVFGPVLAGTLYGIAAPFGNLHGFWTYLAASALFLIAVPIAYFGISRRHPLFARNLPETGA